MNYENICLESLNIIIPIVFKNLLKKKKKFLDGCKIEGLYFNDA